LSIQTFQSWEHIRDLNTILLFTFHLNLLLATETLLKTLRSLFAHCQSIPNFCHRHQTVIIITNWCPEWSDIKHTWTPSRILSEFFQSDFGFSVRCNQLNLCMLQCGNILLPPVKFLDVAILRMSSSLTLGLKFPNKIFIWYLRNLWNIRSYPS
jgi:hypothetical protein